MGDFGGIRGWYRGSIRPGLASPLEIIVIQSTSFCNLDCAYCYLPNRHLKNRFALESIPLLVEKLAAAELLNPDITVCWHAGEPLVLPADYYREAKRLFDAHAPAGVQFRHSFQTNAVLLSDAHAEFMAECEALVGVSIDGPEDLHDSRRKTRDGRGTFARTMAGFERLVRHGVTPSSIAVLGRDSLPQADRIYDFFRGLGVRNAGFNIEEIEGINRESSLSGDAIGAEVRNFFRRLHDRAAADPQPLRIRELASGLEATMSGLAGMEGGSTENNPLSILSVDTNGRLATFSPELLQVEGDSDRFTFGDLATIDFTQLWRNNRFVEMHSQIEEGIALCRANCRYFGSCRGGAPANKMAENGTFVSSETMHCRLSKQAVVDVFEDLLAEQLERRRAQRGDAPPSPVVAPVRAPQPAAPTGARSGARAVLSGAMAEALLGAPPRSALFPQFGAINVYAPADRLRLSAGTQPANDPAYKADALIPREPWFGIDAESYAALGSPARSPAPLNFAALVALPAALRELGAQLAAVARSGDARERQDELSQALSQAVAGWLGCRLEPRSPGVMVQQGGLVTSTIDRTDGKLLGLHLDSWSQLPGQERPRAINRIAINLGPAPRHLLLLDVGLDQVLALLGGAEPGANPTATARHFLAAHPDYPVLSLEVRPGEAYVAATENLIHDGSSLASPGPDMIFTLLGDFNRAAVVPHLLQDRPIAA